MALLEGLIQAHSSTALFGAFIVLGVMYFLSTTSKQGKEPPGPRSLPLIGNLLQLDLKRPHVSLFQLSKKYGSVFTVHFGPKKVVVLAGFNAVKDALVNYSEEFGGRDITPVFYKMSHNHGILFANGESWKEMRRFALTSLRDFGMGKRIIEEKIINEIDYMIQLFGNHKEALNHAVSNIISSIVYGARFDYSDPLFQEMVHCANERIRLTGTPAIQVVSLPSSGVCQWYCNSTFFKLQEQNSFFSEKNLVCSVSNLFAAGTETTAATLRWGLLLMAKYPHVQDRVQEELIRVTGSRQPRVEDRKNLPYTNAVIHEIQRMANIVPMSIPHITTCDVVFQGFHIKKGTSVYPLLTSVLFDENEWETPHTFNPGHFLDEQGQFVKKDAFLPFSAGRRVCLGESLARMELFLVFTSLLQKFYFTPPPGVSESELDLTPAIGFTLNTPPHKLCAVSRA
uniref:Cytochrome P450 2K1-like n=1 Tax=Scleropages formosus TaxID=113540 RepID=A0A8C9SF41_SCLFO